MVRLGDDTAYELRSLSNRDQDNLEYAGSCEDENIHAVKSWTLITAFCANAVPASGIEWQQPQRGSSHRPNRRGIRYEPACTVSCGQSVIGEACLGYLSRFWKGAVGPFPPKVRFMALPTFLYMQGEQPLLQSGERGERGITT